MPVPVVLVTGFLGAGKTTLVNHILGNAGGLRIAAIVNDFGAINIDADLVADADGVVGLQNGCICCTLQGDLLRTIGVLLRRAAPPDAIVIETSGVANPAPIVAGLLDPVIWREAPLDAVLGVVDAEGFIGNPERLGDPLYRAQLAAADFIAVNKCDLATAEQRRDLPDMLRRAGIRGHVLEVEQGRIPTELLFSAGLHAAAAPARAAGSRPRAERFESFACSADRPLHMQRFRAEIERLAPRLLRAKGIVTFAHQPDRPMLFQLVGQRATLAAAPSAGEQPVRLVLIWEIGRLDAEAVRAALEACTDTSG